MPIRNHRVHRRKNRSLSLKSWMFKFKNMTLPRYRSQMDLHQVIDISKTNNPYPCSSVHVGFVRKKKTIHRLRMIKQAHMSQVLYKMRMLHDPGGRKQLLHGDMKPMFFSKQESGESFRDKVETSVNTPKHRISQFNRMLFTRLELRARMLMGGQGIVSKSLGFTGCCLSLKKGQEWNYSWHHCLKKET